MTSIDNMKQQQVVVHRDVQVLHLVAEQIYMMMRMITRITNIYRVTRLANLNLMIYAKFIKTKLYLM